MVHYSVALDLAAIRVAVADYLKLAGWLVTAEDVSVLNSDGSGATGVEAFVTLTDGPKRPDPRPHCDIK